MSQAVQQQALIHSDPIAPVIFGVTMILVAALIGRYTARRFGQPSVLGELLMGILVGNLLFLFHYDLIVVLREGTAAIDIALRALAGMSWEGAAVDVLGEEDGPAFLAVVRSPGGGVYLQVAQAVDIFSRYGVIFLLFHVGLDTCVAELKRVGGDSLRVAVIGVVAPFILGYAVTRLLLPESGHELQLFLGATLAATSIGITARVLADLQQSASPEAHVIVGAAVIDDVLGLIMLAIVSGVVVTGSVSLEQVLRIVILSTLFITGVLLFGDRIIGLLVRLLRSLDEMEAKMFVSFIFAMALAWLANLVGLATIVGAFAAGLLLLDQHFVHWGPTHDHRFTIRELFAPLEAVLVPIFFVLMGLQVKLETFFDWEVITLALALIVAAILGKILSGLGAGRGKKRLAIGLGMMPRGEVGLVFASIGKTLGVIDSATFSALILMVIVTTLLTPPLLKKTMGTGGVDTREVLYGRR